MIVNNLCVKTHTNSYIKLPNNVYLGIKKWQNVRQNKTEFTAKFISN
jgi:hypothetical protein